MKQETNKNRKYRKYDASFKADAVNQIKNGRSVKELSNLLGVSESLLYKWKSQLEGKSRDQSQEVKKLRRQLKKLEEENEILKKALRIFSRSG